VVNKLIFGRHRKPIRRENSGVDFYGVISSEQSFESRFDDNIESAVSSDQPFVLRWGVISTGAIVAKFVSRRV